MLVEKAIEKVEFTEAIEQDGKAYELRGCMYLTIEPHSESLEVVFSCTLGVGEVWEGGKLIQVIKF